MTPAPTTTDRRWRASEGIVQAGYTPATPRQRATFTAGYSDGYYRYPMWASSDRDYFPDHYTAGYRVGAEDGPEPRP